MDENKLKTAVLGLNADGKLLLEAASLSDCFHIEAVADMDSELAKKVAEQYKCVEYDDYRRLIVENHFDCLLVAASMHTCEEYLRMAIKKKFNILKAAPFARNFEESVEFAHLAENENITFAIANPKRFSQSFAALQKALQDEMSNQATLVSAFCAVANQAQPAWLKDRKLAGGGVLLHKCYDIIDQIVWNFGLPQKVYALSTNHAPDKSQRLYLTEDTIVVTMKFNESVFGNITAGNIFGPEQEVVKVYGTDKVLTVSKGNFSVSDGFQKSDGYSVSDDSRQSCTIKMLQNFAQHILLPEETPLCCSSAENLKNMAVIESAYLSAQTGMPEDPERILKMV